MTKRFLIAAAGAAMLLTFSQQMFAGVDEQLTITANGVTATVSLSTTGVLSVTCSGTATQCGDFNQATETPVGTKLLVGTDGGEISWDGKQDGTLTISNNALLNGYTIDDTASGWVDSTNPTLQAFNDVNAQGGVGTVNSIFTDINYNTPGTPLSSELNEADSNTTDSQIKTSSIQFMVLADPTNAVPAANQLYTNTLSGSSNSNGTSGVNFANPYTTGSVSISSEALLTFSGTGKIQANMTLSNVAVPEPASMVLLGTMLLGLTVLVRRKQEKRS